MTSVTRTLTIVNEKGLHARASARFVATAHARRAQVRISHDGYTVSGNSLMSLLALGAARGDSIEVTCTGPEAVALMRDLEALVASGFGE